MTTPEARPRAVSIWTARLTAVWRSLDRSEQLVLAGSAAVMLGALFVLATGGLNTNGKVGVAPVIVVAALAAVGLSVAVHLRSELGGPLGGLLPGLAIGLAVLATLDLIPVVRYSAEMGPFGGFVGVGGRVIALAGGIIMVAGARPTVRLGGRSADAEAAGRPRSSVDERSLVASGAALLAIGWVILLVLGEGFAMRPIDGVGLLAAFAAVLAATARPQSIAPATAQVGALGRVLAANRPVLAVTAAVVVVDGFVSVSRHLSELIGSGPAGVVGLMVYGVAGALLGVAAAREFHRTLRSIRSSTPPSAPVSAS